MVAMNPLIPLSAILAAGRRRDGLNHLREMIAAHDETLVSLGDIATVYGAADALWCVRCLDWSDITIRRAVIGGAVLPAVKRAAAHTADQRVHECVTALERWCCGEDVDLSAAAPSAQTAQPPWSAARAAEAAAWAARAAEAAWSATWSAQEAAWSAQEAAWSAQEAAWSAAEATWSAAEATWSAQEATAQRKDILAAFPPVALAA